MEVERPPELFRERREHGVGCVPKVGARNPSHFGPTSTTSGTFALVELGYARVSTAKQDLDRQIEALLEAGIVRERIYVDKKSGATVDRPGLRAVLEYAREGDVIVVHTLDRLGRTVRDTLNMIHQLSERGIGVRNLADPIRVDSSCPEDPMAQLAVVLLALFAQMERTYTIERAAHARAVAAAKGRRVGRPVLVDPDKLSYAAHLRQQGHTIADKHLPAGAGGARKRLDGGSPPLTMRGGCGGWCATCRASTTRRVVRREEGSRGAAARRRRRRAARPRGRCLGTGPIGSRRSSRSRSRRRYATRRRLLTRPMCTHTPRERASATIASTRGPSLNAVVAPPMHRARIEPQGIHECSYSRPGSWSR